MTLFVLGAGSDLEYGFPSGEKLVEKILTETRDSLTELYPNDPPFMRSQREDHCDNFIKMLKQSDLPSIDSFLGESPLFNEIGKRAIFYQISKAEKEANLTKGLYQYLYQRFSRRKNWIEDFCFITFNYDRSPEYYLSRSALMQNHLTVITGDELKRQVVGYSKQIKILHVHGSLGGLDSVPYFGGSQQELSFYLQRDSHKNFRVIGEASTSEQLAPDHILDVEQKNPVFIKDYFAEAERVVFLGFGYESRNLKKLGIPESIVGKECLGTVYGKTPAELNDVQGDLNLTIAQNISGMFNGHAMKCTEFVKQLDWL